MPLHLGTIRAKDEVEVTAMNTPACPKCHAGVYGDCAVCGLILRSYICHTCGVSTGPMTDEQAAEQRATGHDLTLDKA